MANNIRFPKNASHGDEICDMYGNRWFYDAGQRGWISKGTISVPAVVDEQNNGLVSTDIYKQIRKLKNFVDTGFDLRPFKILPGQDAYWYYFRSSDKLYKFRAEGEDSLRIEIDSGRIHQLLMKEVCPGGRGPTGDKGPTGPDAIAGPLDACFMPSVLDGSRLDFAIYTPTPLESNGEISLPNNHVPEISIRFFKVDLPEVITENQLQYFNITFQSLNQPKTLDKFLGVYENLQNRSMGLETKNLCDIPMSPVLIADSAELAATPSVTVEISPDTLKKSVNHNIDIPLDKLQTLNSVSFDTTTNIVCGSLYLQHGSWSDISSNWCIKSRQKGPDGESGNPGDCKIRIITCTIDNTNITATCPIVNLRLDCDQEIIYSLCAPLLDEVCVGMVNILPDSNLLVENDIFDNTFAAAQITLDECKYIHNYEVSLKDDDLPELNLLHWDPQPGCFTKRHFDRHKFNWMPDTNIPACDSTATWFSPDSVRPGQYTGDIQLPSKPDDDECCEDDWFYCPNVQDAPCGSTTDSKTYLTE